MNKLQGQSFKANVCKQIIEIIISYRPISGIFIQKQRHCMKFNILPKPNIIQVQINGYLSRIALLNPVSNRRPEKWGFEKI